ncbi:MAG: patatin-like phospholipase family protein [Bacteroidota bacterium]
MQMKSNLRFLINPFKTTVLVCFSFFLAPTFMYAQQAYVGMSSPLNTAATDHPANPMSSENENPEADDLHAIVISGGGAFGAWGVGVIEGLSEGKTPRNYSLCVGTSTGSLMGPLVLLRDFSTLKDAYTSVTQKDIFNVNPFKRNGKLRAFNFGMRAILGKNTVGETDNLRKTIEIFFPQQDFEKLKQNNLEFAATTVSLTTGLTHHKSTNDNAYQDMVDWMWTSANQPVFMSLVKKEDQYWGDGGLKELLPVKYALEKKARVIDVIVHNTPDFGRSNDWQPKGILSSLEQTISIFTEGVGFSNVTESELDIDATPDLRETELNFYYMSDGLRSMLPSDLVFDATVMNKLYEIGLNSVREGSIVKRTYRFNNNGVLTLHQN